MVYILDTNILVHFSRGSELYTNLVQELDLFAPENATIISEVSIGEIYAISLMNKWGEKRKRKLAFFLKHLSPINIKEKDIYELVCLQRENRKRNATEK